MALREAAVLEGTTVEALAREAHEGRLELHPYPPCPSCQAERGKPCEPTCDKAWSQVVWLGDWFAWQQVHGSRDTKEATA